MLLHSDHAGTAGGHDEARPVQSDAGQPAGSRRSFVTPLEEMLQTSFMGFVLQLSPVVCVDAVGERHLGSGPLQHSDQRNLQPLKPPNTVNKSGRAPPPCHQTPAWSFFEVLLLHEKVSVKVWLKLESEF